MVQVITCSGECASPIWGILIFREIDSDFSKSWHDSRVYL